MSGAPPPYPTENKQVPQAQQASYPQQQQAAYPSGYQPYQQQHPPTVAYPAQMQYNTYPQAVYTTQPQTIIVDDCHHRHRGDRGGDGYAAANLCCLAAGLACCCALCAR